MRSRNHSPKVPQPDLTPMMDVVLTILTFFIIVSMSLTNQRGFEVALPDSNQPAPQQVDLENLLLVKLDQQGQLLIGETPVSEDQVKAQIKTYLSQNPKGSVVLTAGEGVAYDEVVQAFGNLRDAGGDRVSLGVEE